MNKRGWLMDFRFVALLLMTLGGLVGCAGAALNDVDSVTEAGVTTVDVRPVLMDADQNTAGTRYQATFGKEYEGFKLSMEFDEAGRPHKLVVNATGVGAFAGQAAAAAAVVQIQKDLARMGVEVTDQLSGAIADAVIKLVAPVPAAAPE